MKQQTQIAFSLLMAFFVLTACVQKPKDDPPELLLLADNGSTGVELYRSDGTANGTKLVKDITTQTDAEIYSGAAIGDTLFFSALDGTHGRELWKSDGTEAGTVLVKDISPGRASSNPYGFTAVGSILYFVVASGKSFELWKSDGTTSGTDRVKNLDSYIKAPPFFLAPSEPSCSFLPITTTGAIHYGNPMGRKTERS